ncbi:MAG: hypothetical protein GX878_07595 [Firmicutes bacterium]|nr:hypothetical protein [Bacillota bacterium]
MTHRSWCAFRKRLGKKRLNEANKTLCKQGRKDDDERSDDLKTRCIRE